MGLSISTPGVVFRRNPMQATARAALGIEGKVPPKAAGPISKFSSEFPFKSCPLGSEASKSGCFCLHKWRNLSQAFHGIGEILFLHVPIFLPNLSVIWHRFIHFNYKRSPSLCHCIPILSSLPTPPSIFTSPFPSIFILT